MVEHVLLFILLQIFVKYFTDKVDGNFSSTEKPDQKTSLMSGGLIQILAGFKVAFLIYLSDVCVMCVCVFTLSDCCARCSLLVLQSDLLQCHQVLCQFTPPFENCGVCPLKLENTHTRKQRWCIFHVFRPQTWSHTVPAVMTRLQTTSGWTFYTQLWTNITLLITKV